jgi:hypothetical protein
VCQIVIIKQTHSHFMKTFQDLIVVFQNLGTCVPAIAAPHTSVLIIGGDGFDIWRAKLGTL